MLANTILRDNPPQPMAAKASEEEKKRAIRVDSRFGPIEIHPENILNLPKGLLGFAECRSFGLAMLPEGQHQQFRVLQSMTDSSLAFLVAPFNADSGAIAPADIDEACATLGIDRADLGLLLIVTVRRDDDGAHVSVNLRAPLFVDMQSNTARQYVLPNNRYSIRHAL